MIAVEVWRLAAAAGLLAVSMFGVGLAVAMGLLLVWRRIGGAR